MDIPTALLTDYAKIIHVLFQLVCVLSVIAYLLSRTPTFRDIVSGKLTWKHQAFLVLVFGALSIYGTWGSIEIMGAPVNVRDLGPMVAGLLAGPVAGMGAGLVGALYRSGMGGFTVVPCCLATVIAGLFGGLLWLSSGRKFIGMGKAVLFAGGMELLHNGLVLVMAQPRSMAESLVAQICIPMVLANAGGMFIFAFIISNLAAEQKTKGERDTFHDELERKNAELAVARQIQESFLPESIPRIGGFDLAARSIPAKEVGGDFYDVIVRGPGEPFGIIIADVSGKGVPAALFMALSRTVTRANAMWHRAPLPCIRDANRMISADARYGMFVTLCYGVVDPGSRAVEYVNAGHNPPLLARADGTLSDLGTTGPALGVIGEAEYTDARESLSPGDVLIFYTDGVTEAVNTKDEEFGVGRLADVVVSSRERTARDILDAITESVALHTRGMPQFDDITLLVLKVG
ncbi:MAG: SpoIIE family protein phosphatase [Methanolinea sp.]|nr:SpoIIE family protein phosphatase [Methanolinea sp.]